MLDKNGGSANQLAQENITTMRTFFDVLKSLGSKQRLLFVTGVSKFALAGLFSGANQLDDLTLDVPYRRSTKLVGYTEGEIRQYYDAHLDRLAVSQQRSKDELVAEIMRRYNGYSWGDPAHGTVANSFAVNKVFQSGALGNWWIERSSPRWMLKLVRQSVERDVLPFETNYAYESSFLEKIELDTEGKHAVDLTALLFQTGYLTITQCIEGAGPSYMLNFPNAEIRSFFMAQLREFIFDTATPRLEPTHAAALRHALQRGKVKECMTYIDLCFAAFPRLKHLRGSHNANMTRNELFYDVLTSWVLHVILAPGAVHAGRQGAGGESDSVVILHEQRKVFVFEFKRVESSKVTEHEQAAKDALAQIDQKQYATSLLSSYNNFEFYCVGVTFDTLRLRIGTVLSRKGVHDGAPLDESEGAYKSVLKRIESRLASKNECEEVDAS